MSTRKQHFVMPQAVSLGNRSLRQSPGLETAVENASALVSLLSPAPLYPPDTSQVMLKRPMLRVVGVLGGSRQECSVLAWAIGGPAWIWSLGSHPQGIRHCTSKWGSVAGIPSVAPLAQPHSSSTLGPRTAQLQGCDTHPDHRGLRGIPSACLFWCFLFKFNYYCTLE